MVKPVHIFVDRQELLGYTDLTLRRNKNEMTGEASFSVFMGWLPTEPVLAEATKGREVLIYIGGHLAFTGIIDRRKDTASKSNSKGGSTKNLSIGPNEYTVQFSCRGKTKYLIDSSQQHPTSTMLRVTNRAAIETLVEPWGTELVWEADETELDKIRFRDGGRVGDELARVAEQTSLYMYETRDGRLRVTDGATVETGEPIVLGTNIMQFSTDQAEDTARTEVRVKGQRIEAGVWGNEAVIPTELKVNDGQSEVFIPITVQHYGNATEELLTKRAQYEANKRSSISKQVSVEVFHILQTNGDPWDLGVMHYVEIPPANVFDLMEVIELEYVVSADKTLKTKLTLAPAPVKLASAAGAATSFLGDVPDVNDVTATATSRRAQFGVAGSGLDWAGPALQIVQIITDPLGAIAGLSTEFLGDVGIEAVRPPLQLSPSYKSQDET